MHRLFIGIWCGLMALYSAFLCGQDGFTPYMSIVGIGANIACAFFMIWWWHRGSVKSWVKSAVTASELSGLIVKDVSSVSLVELNIRLEKDGDDACCEVVKRKQK